MEIRVATNNKLIPKERVIALAEKKARSLKIEPLIREAELCYKKLYFIKIMAYAARTPFKPKKTGYILYYDSIMNSGGRTGSVPEANLIQVSDSLVIDSVYNLNDLHKEKANYIEKFILKNYMLKRPELEEVGIEEIYLPYWKCIFTPNDKQESVLINAATGKYNI